MGRENDIKKVLEKIQFENQTIINIIGEPGIGKTEVGNEIFNICKELIGKENSYSISLIDINTVEHVIELILDKMNQDKSGGRELLEKKLSNNKSSKSIFYLDNFEDVFYSDREKAIELLHFLKKCNCLIILTCRINILGIYSYKLDVLDKENSISLFKREMEKVSSQIQYTDEELSRFIGEELGGLPLAIVLAAVNTYSYVSFNKFKQDWDRIKIQGKNIDFCNDEHHKNLVMAISFSYYMIKDEMLTLELWGLVSLMPEGICYEDCEKLIEEYSNECIEKLIKLNLLRIKEDKYFMLPPIRNLFWKLVEENCEIKKGKLIAKLDIFYSAIITQANDRKVDENHREQNLNNYKNRANNIIYYLIVCILEEKFFKIAMEYVDKMRDLFRHTTMYSIELLKLVVKSDFNINYKEILIANAYFIIGTLEFRLDRTNEALSSFKEGEILLNHKIKDTNIIEVELRNINQVMVNIIQLKAQIFLKLEDFEEAERLNMEALSLYKKLDDELGVANSQLNNAHIKISLYKSQKHLLDKNKIICELENALNIYQNLGRKLGIANVKVIFGDLYKELGDDLQSEVYFQQAFDLYKLEKNNLRMAECKFNIAELYKEKKDFKDAHRLYKEAKELLKHEDVEVLIEICDLGIKEISEYMQFE
ncbi:MULTISPECIES: tetratricopeptide repeat protein [unclassified Clostridium]|uniref:tetratricopeptide repeat protein n=1 Tax=unclassified Clostridium TaxID=2614128 RepID=UPI0020795593|nr:MULTISPECIES: tetratricopeptide repeat protein [unclassified Clostridium]